MDDEGTENPGLVRDLYKLVGNYETSTKEISRRLTSIEGRLDRGNEIFIEIRGMHASQGSKIDQIDLRVSKLENAEPITLSKRTRMQILGTTITAAILAMKEVILGILQYLN